jgi:HEAT repeat protein
MKQREFTSRFIKIMVTLVLSLLLVGGIAFADGDDEGREQEAKQCFQDAQKELDHSNYQEAAELYSKVIEDYKDSRFVPDALYWQAFALYRLGDGDDLGEASRLLIRLLDDHPESSSFADAEELYIRVLGERGSIGDVQALEALTRSVVLIGENEGDISVLTAGVRERVRASQRVSARNRVDIHDLTTIDISSLGTDLPRLRFEGASPQVRMLPHVMISGHDEDDDLRITALNALIQMDSDRALPVIRGLLEKRDEDSAGLRRRALFILAQSDSDEAGDLLLEVVREDPDSEVRAEAVFWLGQVPGDEALTAIRLVLDESDDPVVQDKAIHALSQHDDPRALQTLREVAGDSRKPDHLREQAIFWLGNSDDDEEVEFLKGLYRKLSDRDMKETIIASVARHESRDSQKWLMNLVRDEKEETESRAQALFWAGQMDFIPAKDLKNLYGKLDSSEMKEQLIFVLSRQDDQVSRDQLVKIAREEKDLELRKQAIFWLGQTDDPRAMDILEEIINEK